MKKSVLDCEDHYLSSDTAMSSAGTNSITQSERQYFGHKFFAIAIRYWYVAAAAGVAVLQSNLNIQMQSILMKQQKKKMRSKQPNKTTKQ